MHNKRPYNTVNTFSRRPCINQIISYIIIIFDNITFWLLIQTNYENQPCRFTMITLFSCSVIIMLLLGCLTSIYDPSDPIMTEYRNGNTTMYMFFDKEYKANIISVFIVNIVKVMSILHRDTANPVIDASINLIITAFGLIIVSIFIGMILSAQGHLVIFLTSVLLLWTENNWSNFMSSMIVIWLVFAAVLIFSILLLGLIILHLFLIYNNLTTYQYIVSKNNAQVIPKSKIQIHSNTHFQTSSNSISPNKNDPDNIRSDYANRTSNFLPPVSGFKNFQKQLDKVSAFRSIDLLEQSKNDHQTDQKENSFADMQKSKVQNQQSKEGFEEFYKTHRGLKLLIGNGVNIKSKKSQSCQQIRPNERQQNSVSANSQQKDLDQMNKVKEKFQKMNLIFENDT